MYFYPTLTDELLDASGYSATQYVYSYNVEGAEYKLIGKGKNTIRFDDESWRIERDGLRLKRKILFEAPKVLYGRKGIACNNAELGICIIWINRSLTQMGTILPSKEYMDEATKVYEFDYEFGPGMIKGDLSLEMQLYIRKSAQSLLPDEMSLMNDEGVTVGIIDVVSLDLGSAFMDFPITEVNDAKKPMWWLELSDWSEPKNDLFDEENINVFLNVAYDSCPRFGETVKNQDVLIDIITTVYVMLFNRIRNCGCLADTINDVGLEPGSISKILYYFYDSCEPRIDFSSEERMHKSIWMNVANMVRGGEDA